MQKAAAAPEADQSRGAAPIACSTKHVPQMDSISRSDSDATSTATTTVSSRSKHKRERNRERSKVSAKAVIRHLPPSMTAEEFLAAVDPLPDHNFFYFSKADHGLGQFSFSRAYVNFLTFRDMELFRDKFDGYVFVDSRGNEYPAVVEFAPFQKIPQMYWNPKLSEKRDKKCATIDQDADYLSFVQTLSERKNESLPSAETYLEEMEARDKEIRANRGCPKVITPLMEFVLSKYTGKFKQKDDRRTDDRKHRNENRTRDEKSKKKDDTVVKKNKDKNKDKDKCEKSGQTRKERRNEKRKRERKEKQSATGPAAAANGSKNQPAAAVRVLQKEKSHAKESPAAKVGSVSKNATSSSQQSLSNNNKTQSDHKPKQDRKQTPAAGIGTAASKSEVNTHRDAGDNIRSEKVAKVKRDEVKKERIPNKDRPAIQIYRPGSRRTTEASASKSESVKNRETRDSVKSSEARAENGRRPSAGAKSDPNRNPKQTSSQAPSSKPQPKSESNAPFRTKVFKSTRKATSGPANA